MIIMLLFLDLGLFKIPGLFLTIGVILILFAIVFFIIGNKKAKDLPAQEEEDAKHHTVTDSTVVSDKNMAVAKPVAVETKEEKVEVSTPVVPTPVTEVKDEVVPGELKLDTPVAIPTPVVPVPAAPKLVEPVKAETPEVKVEVPTVPEVKVETPEVKIEVPEVKIETPEVAVPVEPEVKIEVPAEPVKVEVPEVTPEVKIEVPEVKVETPEVTPEVKIEVPAEPVKVEVPEVPAVEPTSEVKIDVPVEPVIKIETPEVKTDNDSEELI